MSPPAAPDAKALRIAVDYNTAVIPGAGVARYTRSLVEALARLDRTNRYTLFYGGRGLSRETEPYRAARALVHHHGNFAARELPLSARLMTLLWQRARVPWPLERSIGPHDIVHAPDYVLPPHRQGRGIVTIHDLSFLIVPETAEPRLVAYLRAAVPRAVRHANLVIAVSETTRQDVLRLLPVPPERVVTVLNGVDPAFHRFNDAELERRGAEVRARLDLPEAYLLHVGTLEPRKNLVRLIEAYHSVLTRGRARGHALVLAGRRGWRYDPIFARVRELGLDGYVRFLDHVPEPDLPVLYSLATVVAYPSLYEGFGLPVAEAMACGVPVLTSRVGATAEVAGNAALLVDPTDPGPIAAGLEVLLENLDTRTHLAEAGLKRAESFTWDAAARQVLGLYERRTPLPAPEPV